MSCRDENRVERLVTEATGSLDPASLWLIATSAPEQKAAEEFDSASAARVQEWIGGEVLNWPAPIAIGEDLLEVGRDKLVFLPQKYGRIAKEHYCEIHADGGAVVAIQIGTLREAAPSQKPVWAVGEGALAWLSIAYVRLCAAWASRAGSLGQAAFDLRLYTSAAVEDRINLQLWNFSSGVNAPVSEARAMTQPSKQIIDLSSCLSANATLAARSLLLPLLGQFGHNNSRHIDATGTVTSANFVGHAPAVSAWARAIGVVCR